MSYAAGDRVFHERYGWGTVEFRQDGGLAHVNFDGGDLLAVHIDEITLHVASARPGSASGEAAQLDWYHDSEIGDYLMALGAAELCRHAEAIVYGQESNENYEACEAACTDLTRGANEAARVAARLNNRSRLDLRELTSPEDM